jgi:hypothetical protein
MKQRTKLREWIMDHFDVVIKAFPHIPPGELRKGVAKITDDNHLLFIYGVVHVTIWREETKPPNRQPLDRLLSWGYNQDDLISSALWIQLNRNAGPDEYVEVQVVNPVDPSRN